MRIVSQVVLPVATASTSITVNGNGSEINQELADRHAIRATPATIIDGKLKFIGVPSRESAEKALGLKREG